MAWLTLQLPHSINAPSVRLTLTPHLPAEWPRVALPVILFSFLFSQDTLFQVICSSSLGGISYPISNTSQSFPFFRTFAMQLFHPFGIRVLPSPSPLSAYCHKHVKMRIARPILPNTHNARYRPIQPTQTLMSRRLNQALSSRLSSLLHCPHCPLEFSNGLRV